ncbi:MAG: MotA/TolQ/ExbB proton channel family protein [bacterium]
MLSQNALDLVFNAGIVAKTVLVILFLFSVVSWAIIFDKLRVFRRLKRESEEFLRFFRKRNSVRDILAVSRKFPTNPFVAVFKAAYWQISQNERNKPDASMSGAVGMLREQRPKSQPTSDDLIRIFDSAASREVLKLEKFLVFLATTGSVSPFFGLFGTVWGVMSAFLAIGFTGSADLSVVAPGIAEALITTVAGLGAAIPAVIAYNYFVNKLKRLSSELEVFYSDLLQVLARKAVHEVQ